MSFNELSNEDVLYIYFSNKKTLDRYHEIFEEKGINDTINILDMGSVKVFTKLYDDELEELENSELYKTVVKLNDKFESIAYLIEESNPEVYKKIEDLFKSTTL
jgi:hypothetical protein